MSRHDRLDDLEASAIYWIAVANETYNIAPPTSRIPFKRRLLRGLERKGELVSYRGLWGLTLQRRWHLPEWNRVPFWRWYPRQVWYFVVDNFVAIKKRLTNRIRWFIKRAKMRKPIKIN